MKRLSVLLIPVLFGSMLSAFQDGTTPGPPAGFVLPPLHPKDSELATRKLGEGVYALLSPRPFVDNSGFIVGEKGVLVIDAHISSGMARKIQAAVKRVTDKPILYLVNTNYHGDHTFGNNAFPRETKIIAHVKTAERMSAFEREKDFLLPLINGDRDLWADVKLRLPDVVFESSMRIDLGRKLVEIHYFGRGNTPGDTIVYVPESRVAWTGNFILGDGSIPFLIEGQAAAWTQSLSRLTSRLEIEKIVPGHGALTDSRIVGRYLAYLNELLGTVRKDVQAGRTEEQVLAGNALTGDYLPPESAAEQAALLRGFHLWNLQRVYWDLTK